MLEKTLAPARHEPRDVGAPFILIGVPLVVFTVVALAALVFGIFPRAMLQEIMRRPFPQYPSPQLQPSARADMEKFHQQEMLWLNGTGWIDKAQGVVHIPIADAMRKVAQEGIPGWPAPQDKRP